MLYRLSAIIVSVCLLSCGGGKHEPVAKDSIPAGNVIPGAGMGAADSTNGAIVTPIDTANSQHRDSSKN